MKVNRLVLDVTTLMQWKSPHVVGIVRVQLELARALLAKSESTQMLFVQFSSVKSQFEVVLREDVNNALHSFETKNSHEIKLQNQMMLLRSLFSLNNFQTQCKSYIKQLIFFIFPERYHYLIQRSAEVYRKQGAKTLFRRVLYKLLGKTAIKQASKPHEAIDFFSILDNKTFKKASFLQKDDCLISSGLDWDVDNYEYILYQKKNTGFQWIGICYDIIALIKPEYVQNEQFVKIFFKHYYFLNHGYNKIACISDFSKDQFQQESLKQNIEEGPILKTIHLGAALVVKDNTRFENVEQNILNKNGISKPYILYVSTVEARKNHNILLKVWNHADKKDILLPEIIFVGMIGWGTDSLLAEYNANRGIQKKIHFLTNVTDRQLDYLYKNCLFTVFPSYIEGWGLAAAESLLYGKVCVISTAGALIEATQGLMPAIDPYDVDGWLAAIYDLTYDLQAREKLEKSISKSFQHRDWKEFSEDFFNFCMRG